MDNNIIVYILTHKEIKENYDETLYHPVLNGAITSEHDFGYIRDDDSCDNISALNDYYGELSGEYWAWKNSNADIIGFCHYRRWFIKNPLTLEKLNKNDIINDLKKFDIILPHKVKFDKILFEFHKESNIVNPYYDAEYEDYLKTEKVLEEFFPDYVEYYDEVMNGKKMWAYNMFICKREVADEYFTWLFGVFEKLENEINLKKYDSRDPRVYAFIAERLLTTYVLKNKLKVKEYDILFTVGRKLPILEVLYVRFPRLTKVEKFVAKIFDLIKKQ